MAKPKDWKITKFLKEKAPGALGDVLEIAGDFTGIEALEKIGEKINGNEDLTESDKQHALKLIDQDMKEQEEISRRWISDNQQQSKLPRLIRPIILAYSWIIMTVILILNACAIEFNDLVLTIFEYCFLAVNSAYFGARTIEKFRGANMGFLKKGGKK